MTPMFVLVTDFGIESPYVGQMKAVLHQRCPGFPVVDLFHNIPAYDIRAGAYLLPAYASDFPVGSVFLCVVDPGVGSERAAVALYADGKWYVGPDNGFFAVVASRSSEVQWYEVTWRPEKLSRSFHGRDLFAPAAAMLANDDLQGFREVPPESVLNPAWSEEFDQVVYVDHFGNLITGRRASSLRDTARLDLAGRVLNRARTFSSVKVGEAFWYENANGLVEIAVNQGNASALLDVGAGSYIAIQD